MPLSLFLPLRVAVPFFVAIVFSVLAIIHGMATWEQLSASIEKNSIHHVRALMGMAQYGVNEGYRHNSRERIQAELAQLSLDPYMDVVAVSDANGQLLVSGQTVPGKKTLAEIASGYDREQVRQVLRQGVSRVQVCAGGMAVCGYFRVNLYGQNDDGLRGGTGLLYLQYDLAQRYSLERGHITAFVASLVTAILVAAVLLAAFLHAVVTRRVDDLQFAAQMIADGEFSVRSGVQGKDELGRLAFEINKMAGFIEQRQAELEENEQRYRLLFDAAGDAMFVHCLDAEGGPGCFLEVNDSACRQLGYSREELLAMSPDDLDAPQSATNIPAVMQQLERDGTAVFNAIHQAKDGTLIPVEISAHRFEYKGRPMVLSVARSMASRKQLEKELHHFKGTLDLTNDRVLMFDENEHRFIYSNRGAEWALNYPGGQLLSLHPRDIMPNIDVEWFEAGLSALKHGEKEVLRFETQLLGGSGKTHPVDISLQFVRLEGGGSGRYVMIARDITEQKKIRHDLASANKALRTLSSCNMTLVKSTDEQQLLDDICRAVVKEGGYLLSWIGFAEVVDGEKRVVPRASAGVRLDYLRDIRVKWDESELGSGPVGRAIRDGRVHTVQDVLHDTDFSPWRDSALQRGYQSVIALPLREGEEVIGALVIYSDELDAFMVEEEKLFGELAEDISFGIRSMRTVSENVYLQQSRIKAEKRLRDNLVETIMAMAAALEKRDPYTAGHQKRVATLAVAIARELGLSESQRDGVRFGALIHDIGKIYIPAEILNRPGKLTDNEFNLIKSHPRVGYEIIQDVTFPWPVAQMIHQHHERLDGSGYPDGLQGEDILLEARILAVADVVEAITSHRPYRPGMGQDKALEVIVENRGNWFDPQVVDACVAVLQSGDWRWEEG